MRSRSPSARRCSCATRRRPTPPAGRAGHRTSVGGRTSRPYSRGWRRRRRRRRRQRSVSRVGTSSSNHCVTGIADGSNEPRSSERVARPPAWGTSTVAAAEPPTSSPPRSSTRRSRSTCRRCTGRARTCQAAKGSEASAAPTWTCWTRTGPRSRMPDRWANPVDNATTTKTASSSEGADARSPRRPRPRRLMTDFHGATARTATPAAPWAIVGHRFQPVPMAYISDPLATATTRSTSSARLVRRVVTGTYVGSPT